MGNSWVARAYTLSSRIGKVVDSHTEVARPITDWAETATIYTMHEARMRAGGDATSQLDIPSLKPLFVAGCGRGQLGVQLVIGLLQ